MAIAKQEKTVAENTLSKAISAWDKTSYLLNNHFMRLNYKDADKNNKYLMVDTAYWQASVNPEDGDLKIVNSKPRKDDHLLISARYFFKLTYHPSQDSLVVEPLNASDMSEKRPKPEHILKILMPVCTLFIVATLMRKLLRQVIAGLRQITSRSLLG